MKYTTFTDEEFDKMIGPVQALQNGLQSLNQMQTPPPPPLLYNIVCGLQRYIRQVNSINFFIDPAVSGIKKVIIKKA